MKRLAILSLVIAAQVHARGQGYIVPNGVTFAGTSPTLGSEIHVLQNSTNGNYTELCDLRLEISQHCVFPSSW
jgi:hypothetical protein